MRYFYSHFTDEKIEAKRGQVTCPRSCCWWEEQRLKLITSDSKLPAFNHFRSFLPLSLPSLPLSSFLTSINIYKLTMDEKLVIHIPLLPSALQTRDFITRIWFMHNFWGHLYPYNIAKFLSKCEGVEGESLTFQSWKWALFFPHGWIRALRGEKACQGWYGSSIEEQRPEARKPPSHLYHVPTGIPCATMKNQGIL